MRDLYQYFYAVASACFIAVGTGFVSLTPDLLEYDKEAYQLVFEVEEKLDMILELETDCNQLNLYRAQCNLAIHMVEANEAYLNLLNTYSRLLVIIAIGMTVLGTFFHYLKLHPKAEKI